MFGRFNAQSGSLCELLRADNLRMYFAEKAHKFKTFFRKDPDCSDFLSELNRQRFLCKGAENSLCIFNIEHLRVAVVFVIHCAQRRIGIEH